MEEIQKQINEARHRDVNGFPNWTEEERKHIAKVQLGMMDKSKLSDEEAKKYAKYRLMRENFDRRAVEQEYGLEDGELDGFSIREAEALIGEEEGALDRFIIEDDEEFDKTAECDVTVVYTNGDSDEFAVTGKEVHTYTLEEVREADMPALEVLMEEYYKPEFAEHSAGDVIASIDKTKKAIETWI